MLAFLPAMPVATNLVGRTRELAAIDDVLDALDSGMPSVRMGAATSS